MGKKNKAKPIVRIKANMQPGNTTLTPEEILKNLQEAEDILTTPYKFNKLSVNDIACIRDDLVQMGEMLFGKPIVYPIPATQEDMLMLLEDFAIEAIEDIKAKHTIGAK